MPLFDTLWGQQLSFERFQYRRVRRCGNCFSLEPTCFYSIPGVSAEKSACLAPLRFTDYISVSAIMYAGIFWGTHPGNSTRFKRGGGYSSLRRKSLPFLKQDCFWTRQSPRSLESLVKCGPLLELGDNVCLKRVIIPRGMHF